MYLLGLAAAPNYAVDSATTTRTAFTRPMDAFSKQTILVKSGADATAPAVGMCPAGTVQMGLVCVQAPNTVPPTPPPQPPECPPHMYWTGGECASTSPPTPPPGPSAPPLPFTDVGQQPTPNAPPAGTMVTADPAVIPPGYTVVLGHTIPKWWLGIAAIAGAVGGYYGYKHYKAR